MHKKIASLCVFLLISFSMYSQEGGDQLHSWDFKTLEKYINSDSLSNDEARQYANAYLRKAKHQKDLYRIIDGYCLIVLSSTPEEKTIYADSIIHLSNQVSDYKMENALIFKGVFYYKKTDYKQELDYYLKALEYEKKKHNKNIYDTLSINYNY